MHVVAIVNPAAGAGRAPRVWRQAERLLRASGVRTDGMLTNAPGAAEALAREAADSGADVVAAVGGDGTVHEVVNGLYLSAISGRHSRLAVIPAGTGGDFARTMRMRRGVRAAVARILAGSCLTLDLGLAQPSGRVFVNFAETGLGAAVVRREREMDSHLPGRLSFFLAAVDAARSEDNIEAYIEIDGLPAYDDRLVSVVVANGRYFGGGMKIAPAASNRDGLLDILILGDFSRSELLTQIWKLYPGSHVRHPKVLWQRASSVIVRTAPGTPLDLDGELLNTVTDRFSILPSVLSVLA